MHQPSSISDSAESKRKEIVKRLLTLMLALTLVVGGAAVVLAQDLPGQDQKEREEKEQEEEKE
jgi:hypothetical protein